MLKYQKFQALISKWDVLSKKDQMSWFMQKPNEKLLSCVIILWEVTYDHFYNWDRLLDFVSVVYDLIELIIEASLWSKDYSTLDTHPQHTRLWFNECLSHLCNCTCSNMIYMLIYLFIKPKNIFECFMILYFRVLCFCSKCFFVFFFKNWFRGCLARSSRLRASHKKGLREINFFILSHKNSRYYIATTSQPTASREMQFG